MTAAAAHAPVLREAVLDFLRPAPGRRFVDGTYGCGGHAAGLLAAGAEVLALDLDGAAIGICRAEAAGQPRLRCARTSFRDLGAALADAGWPACDGLLLDLGVSSPQLDDPARGFTYRAEAELDLRFDRDAGEPAWRLLARLSERELADLIWRFGEERRSRRIAAAVAAAAAREPVRSTSALRAAVEAAVPAGPGRTATLSRVFQALRIAVNGELEALALALAQVPDVLAADGVVVIIAYHSLEDRLVKQWLVREGRDCVCPPDAPACRCGHRRTMKSLTGRPLGPGPEELALNPRARSARLRAARRLAEPASPAGSRPC
ncbi:MAG: 16S rRNA (cytosine(1402)-N(4))-methyltransferase RsmH [Candidatus Krumholzibacteriia bacterium]